MNVKEIRSCSMAEVRAVEKEGRAKIVGYAAVFNEPSNPLGGFIEYVAPGAFRRTLKEGADVRALLNHDPNYVLGRNKAGTLKLEEDDKGLRVEIDPPDTTWARDLMESLKRGDINQMSFGFRVREDKWEKRDGKTVRTLLDVDLFDVSVVTYPAYPATTVGVRNHDLFAVPFANHPQLLVIPEQFARMSGPLAVGFPVVVRTSGDGNERRAVPSDISRELAAPDTPWSKPSLSDFTNRAWDELSDEDKITIARHFAWAPKLPPDNFSDLKLPHHRPSDGRVVWRGVVAAMAALLGARGGVDIPASERRAVYDHLASHYRQFDKEPPDFRSADDIVADYEAGRLVTTDGRKLEDRDAILEAYAAGELRNWRDELRRLRLQLLEKS